MAEIVDIGSATRDAKTNAVLVQAKGSQLGDEPDDAPSNDGAPFFGTLGITAIPWPADARGNAQGTKESPAGHDAVITSMRDARAAGIVEELAPGETAIHSSGPDFDSRVFLKKQLAAIMVGDDVALVLDRENQRVTLTAFGLHFELSAANGAVLTTGGATVQLKDSLVALTGQVVIGGRTPKAQVMGCAAPGVGVTGTVGAGVPIPGVFFG